jgi:molybdopterin biosynthesis enzyme
MDGRLSVNLFPNQSSGVLSSVAKSNVLIRQLAGDEISLGSDVDVMFY